VVYDTLIAGQVKAIEFSYSLLIQFILANVTWDAVLKEIIGILLFDVLFALVKLLLQDFVNIFFIKAYPQFDTFN
jgi:hypothetical protein